MLVMRLLVSQWKGKQGSKQVNPSPPPLRPSAPLHLRTLPSILLQSAQGHIHQDETDGSAARAELLANYPTEDQIAPLPAMHTGNRWDKSDKWEE